MKAILPHLLSSVVLLWVPAINALAGSVGNPTETTAYAVEFSRYDPGQVPAGWSDLVDYRPTRNWAVDGQGLLRVILKEYVGNPTTGDRLVRRQYLETYGMRHFAGLLAYDCMLADGTTAKGFENGRIQASFKKTPDPNVFFGVFLRLRDRDNYFATRFSGTNRLELIEVREGVETILDSTTTQQDYSGAGMWTLQFEAHGGNLSARLLDERQREQAWVEAATEDGAVGMVGLTATTFAAAKNFEIGVADTKPIVHALSDVFRDNAARAQARRELHYAVVEPITNGASLNTRFTALTDAYDIIVAGAGTGGVSAALQAARMGARVLLLEETDWIGGQMAAAAVTSMDEGGIWGKNPVRERGLYREFHESAVNFYYTRDIDPFTAYHFNRQSEGGYEPRIARGVLYGLIEETRGRRLPGGAQPTLDLCVRTSVIHVEKQGRTIRGVTVEEWTEQGPRTREILCRVLVDATEYGDVLPLAGARYRLGTTTSDDLVSSSPLQAHTWLGVIREYPGGIPDQLRLKKAPPGFEKIEKRFSRYTLDGARVWGREAKGHTGPRHWSVYVDWRGMPDSSVDTRGEPTEQWHTRCGLNGGNDYPVTAATIEDPAQRRVDECEGINKTLGIIYWFQHTLGLPWAVAEDEGYHSPLNVYRMEARGLRKDLLPIAARLPQHPYVRECRRIIGVETLRAEDLYPRDRGDEQGRHWTDAVAINDYSMDLHGTREHLEPELDRPDYRNATGPFQIPFGVFIPEEIDGLLPAEKNFSQSRLANGATRLQPATMLTGQAVGAMAALSVEQGVPPRKLNIIDVQCALLAAGDTLVPRWYSDVAWGTPLWRATQLLSLYGIMDRSGPMETKVPLGEGREWGAEETLSRAELEEALKKLQKWVKDDQTLLEQSELVPGNITRGEFALAAAGLLKTSGEHYLRGPIGREDSKGPSESSGR